MLFDIKQVILKHVDDLHMGCLHGWYGNFDTSLCSRCHSNHLMKLWMLEGLNRL